MQFQIYLLSFCILHKASGAFIKDIIKGLKGGGGGDKPNTHTQVIVIQPNRNKDGSSGKAASRIQIGLNQEDMTYLRNLEEKQRYLEWLKIQRLSQRGLNPKAYLHTVYNFNDLAQFNPKVKSKGKKKNVPRAKTSKAIQAEAIETFPSLGNPEYYSSNASSASPILDAQSIVNHPQLALNQQQAYAQPTPVQPSALPVQIPSLTGNPPVPTVQNPSSTGSSSNPFILSQPQTVESTGNPFAPVSGYGIGQLPPLPSQSQQVIYSTNPLKTQVNYNPFLMSNPALGSYSTTNPFLLQESFPSSITNYPTAPTKLSLTASPNTLQTGQVSNAFVPSTLATQQSVAGKDPNLSSNLSLTNNKMYSSGLVPFTGNRFSSTTASRFGTSIRDKVSQNLVSLQSNDQ